MHGFAALFSDQTQTKGSSFFFWQVSLDSYQCFHFSSAAAAAHLDASNPDLITMPANLLQSVAVKITNVECFA